MRVEEVAEISDRRLHSLDPAARQFVLAAIIKSRDHIAFEQIVKGFSFNLILVIGVVVNFAAPDRPSDCGLWIADCGLVKSVIQARGGKPVLLKSAIRNPRSAIPSFVPPPVTRAQIQYAVRRRFHPARAARFERAPRRAQRSE